MAKKKKDTYSPFNKGMAKVLSTTLVVATVVTGVPMNTVVADDTVVTQGVDPAVDAVNAAADDADLKTALEDAALGLTLGSYAGWGADDQAAVVQMVKAARGAGFADRAAIQTAFTNAVNAQAAFMVAKSAATEADLKTALEATNLGLDLSIYSTWKDIDKGVIVADLFNNIAYLADLSSLSTYFDAIVGDRSYMANLNNATTTAEVKNAYLAAGLNLGDFVNYSAEDQEQVLALMLAKITLGGFQDGASAEMALEECVAVIGAVDAVNQATDAAQMEAALEDPALGLELGTYYDNLDAAGQTAVAGIVLSNRLADGDYAAKADVQNAFDDAVKVYKALLAVNEAQDASAMKTAMMAADLDLTFGEYMGWLSLDQTVVAQSVLASKASGYASRSDVQTALDAAIAARKPVASVNIAADAAALRNALDDVSLVIDKSAYSALDDANKNVVATEIYNARPLDGYTDKDAIEAALKDALVDFELKAAKEALNIIYMDDETAAGVTKQLMLPLTAGDGITVTWESDNNLVITPNGAVMRPSSETGDVTVTLTATIKKGDKSVTKDFPVTVLSTVATTAPLESDIIVKNNYSIKDDTVKVNNLQAGDVVTVYAADGTTVLAEGTVQPGNTWAIVQIDQLGTTNGQIKVSVTRPGYEASELVSKHYVEEGAKAYTVTNPSLDRTAGLTATVRVVPTGNVELTGDKYVVFQLMNGTKPEGIVVKQSSDHNAETLTAEFNKPNIPSYTVRVFVVDAYGNDESSVGNILANPVTAN